MRIWQRGQGGCSTGESANIVGVMCDLVMAAPRSGVEQDHSLGRRRKLVCPFFSLIRQIFLMARTDLMAKTDERWNAPLKG
jgi:hypothetical protein